MFTYFQLAAGARESPTKAFIKLFESGTDLGVSESTEGEYLSAQPHLPALDDFPLHVRCGAPAPAVSQAVWCVLCSP